MTDLLRAYATPNKYAVELHMDEIVCDENIDIEYAESLAKHDVSKMTPIIVIKHPSKRLYAVLDGHHRFKAAQLRGLKSIRAVVVDDYVGLGFDLTSKGGFLPSPELTRHIRVPIKRFVQYIQSFLLE